MPPNRPQPKWNRAKYWARHDRAAGTLAPAGAEPSRRRHGRLLRAPPPLSARAQAAQFKPVTREPWLGGPHSNALFRAPHRRLKATHRIRLNSHHPLALPAAGALVLAVAVLLVAASCIKAVQMIRSFKGFPA